MKPAEFVAKWSRLQQKETALYASHFDDVCRLVGHATPTEHAAAHDPTGAIFSFQTSTVKRGGQKGFADVYFRDHFIWEYKGPHADLARAYQQLQLLSLIHIFARPLSAWPHSRRRCCGR